MAKVHAGHSTNSAGKLRSQTFIKDRVTGKNVGGVVLGLVGAGEGLKRHVDWYRSMGMKKVLVYERDDETYLELLREKEKYFPGDDDIIIRLGFAEKHDFQQEPVGFVDFDSCDSFGRVAKEQGLDFENLFLNEVPVIALTFTARSRERTTRLAERLGVKGTSQAEIAVMVLHRLFPKYSFEIFRYRGVDGEGRRGKRGVPMFVIMSTLQQ